MFTATTASFHSCAARAAALGLLALILAVTLPGCDVRHDGAKGKDNVDVSTPFGGVHVHADKDASTVNTGLSVYPGATPSRDGDDEDNADVGFSFGKLRVGVHVAEYLTPDPQDKVMAFYRKDLARYGDVLECHGNEAVGTVKRTSGGLTCAHGEDNNHIHVSSSEHDLELRAGSREHQHVVGLERKDGQTQIGLVAVDLPHQSDQAEEEE